jgi:FixJ family two-component response regulator
MSEDQPTVFVIDDDVSMREAIEAMVRLVGLPAQTFASTNDFLQTPLPDGPNCLVLDVRLPGVSGLDFQHELSKADIRIPIVFITGFGDIPMSVRAMKAGAVEFLTKPFRDQDLLDAIQHALEKDRMMRKQRLEVAELRKRFETLTEREGQVMTMVVAGKLNREIAAVLGTSEITVKVQRSHVMRKMLAQSLIDLVRMSEKLEIRAAE